MIHFDNNLQKSFIFSLLTNLKYPPNNREYPQDVLDICFSLYSISEESYELLVKVLDLPSKSTIKDHFSKIVKEETKIQSGIDNLNDMIDNALEGDEIIPENETQRKTLISMLKERKEDEIKASNYYKVERIDEVIKDLQPVRIVNDEFLRYRLSQLTKRLELINQKRDQINEERISTFRDLNE